jgi:hypothetical protein
MRLTVREANRHDVRKDIVRVFAAEREGVQRGRIAKVSVPDRGTSTLASIGGLKSEERGQILLDYDLRQRLRVAVGETSDFTFQKVGILGHVLWAYRASDPMTRITTRIAVWSSIVGTMLALASFFA